MKLRREIEPLISSVAQKREDLWARVVKVCCLFKQDGTYVVEVKGKKKVITGLCAFSRRIRDEFGFTGFAPEVVTKVIQPVFNLMEGIIDEGVPV